MRSAPGLAAILAGATLVGGCGLTMYGTRRIVKTHAREEKIIDVLRSPGGPLAVASLAGETGLSRRWIVRALKRLERRGDLERKGDVVCVHRTLDSG